MNIFTDIKKLRAFVAVAEEGSVTQAAQRLNVAQPWLSEQLHRLEALVGLVLFERASGKPPRLTRQGEEFLSVARKLLESCGEAAMAIEAMRHGDDSSVTLGVDPITLFLPGRNELISNFAGRWPRVKLHIESRLPHELFKRLAARDHDLIITSTPDQLADFDILSLRQSERYLFIPRSAGPELEAAAKAGAVGMKILTLPDSYHPVYFEWLDTTIPSGQFEKVECPEHSVHALLRYSTMMKIATILPDFSASLPEMKRDFHIRKLKQPQRRIQWSLVRRKELPRGPADKFWQFAEASAELFNSSK